MCRKGMKKQIEVQVSGFLLDKKTKWRDPFYKKSISFFQNVGLKYKCFVPKPVFGSVLVSNGSFPEIM